MHLLRFLRLSAQARSNSRSLESTTAKTISDSCGFLSWTSGVGRYDVLSPSAAIACPRSQDYESSWPLLRQGGKRCDGMDKVHGCCQTRQPRSLLWKAKLGCNTMVERCCSCWTEWWTGWVLGAHQVLCHRSFLLTEYDTPWQTHWRSGHHGRDDMACNI